MQRFSSFLFVILYCVVLNGQYAISGKIINESDRSPIIGATVVIAGTHHNTISDIDGTFSLENIKKASYQLEINSVGFTSNTISINLVEDTHLSITMSEKIFDLPDVVIESMTMTGGIKGVQKSLGSAHFIDQKELQKFSYTDINRTLRNIPGINIQEEDGYGLRPNIGLRATGSERTSKITVMEDGILAAPAPYAAPAAYYFPSVGRMEAIEILKGSSQIKYGPYTTGGAINLVSTPIPTEFAGHADFIAGSDNYKMFHSHLGNAHKNVAYLVETLQYSSDGFKELDNGATTGFNKEDYLAKLRFHTNPNAPIYQSLTFKIGQASERSDETYVGLTEEDFKLNPVKRYAGSQNDIMKTKQTQYSLSHFAQLTDFLDIYSSIYRTDFSRNWYKLDRVNGQNISAILIRPDIFKNDLSIIKGSRNAENALALIANNRSYYSRGFQTNLLFHLKKAGIKHKVDVGLRIHEDQIDRFQWTDLYNMNNGIMTLSLSGQPGTESNRIEKATARSAYFQYKVEFQNLTLTSGLRYENITIHRQDFGKEDPGRSGSSLATRDNSVDVFIPGLAASLKLDHSTSLFGGIHRGFAPPGSKEGTLPEKSWNFELGWRIKTKKIWAQVLGYYNDYSNLLGTDLAASGGTGSQDLFNGGSAIARGIEAELSYELISSSSLGFQLPIALSYTYSKAYFTNSFESEYNAWQSVEEGDLLPYIPRHQMSFSISLEHEKFLFDISSRYSSSMLTLSGTDELPQDQKTDEAFTIDLALNYKLSPRLHAFVNSNNITNNIYIVSRRPSGVRPNAPRTYNFGLKANF